MATALDRLADTRPGWVEPMMIEFHQDGVRIKAMNPNTPISDDDLHEDALRCWDAGATAIHDHNSNSDLLGKAAYDDCMNVWDRTLKARPGRIWYPTTCNNSLVAKAGESRLGFELI